MKISLTGGIRYRTPVQFKSGHTFIYTDFDNTYMPFSHDEICKESPLSHSPERRNEFSEYFSKISNFLNTRKDKITLLLTTGRNPSEYYFVERKIKDKNLTYHSPDVLITNNGGDKFYKKDGRWVKDDSKAAKIQKYATNWDSQKLKSSLASIIKRTNPSAYLVEAPVNADYYCYEQDSLETVLNRDNNPQKRNYASFEGDYAGMIEVAFSKYLNTAKIKDETVEMIKNAGVGAEVEYYENDKHTWLPQYKQDGSYEIAPSTKLILTAVVNGKKLSKLFDTREEIKNIIKNDTNDLVIAAGDEINDEEMLNPLNYLELYNVKIDKNSRMEDVLSNPEVLSALKKLPFAAIITSNSPSLEHLRKMGEILDGKGIHKIYCAKNNRAEFLSKIQKAMYNYSQENDEYSFGMGNEIFNALLEGGVLWS